MTRMEDSIPQRIIVNGTIIVADSHLVFDLLSTGRTQRFQLSKCELSFLMGHCTTDWNAAVQYLRGW